MCCEGMFVIDFEHLVTIGDRDDFKLFGPVWEPTLKTRVLMQ